MVFQIKNETGNPIVIDGVSYAPNAYVDIVGLIGREGVTWSRNDVDGPNAGRALSARMIRDRVAIKNKWQLTMPTASEAPYVRAILLLVEPESYHIITDYPTGASAEYEVYSNNIQVKYLLRRASGLEYYTGISIPVVEM